MPGGAAEQIKERLDVAEIIRSYIPIQQAGKYWKGNCPFHKEKTPSFVITPEKQIWHCFGCNVGGDVISFVMRYENIDFTEAIKILGEKAGLDIRQFSGPDQRQFEILYQINNVAKDFFRDALWKVSEALEYARGRGLKDETLKDFEVGFAYDTPEALLQNLLKAGFRPADIERSGLCVKNERGAYRDRFRNRLMFPLYNQFGKTIGFTGRIMPNAEHLDLGKYVNSPETPIFHKSKFLFGLHKAKGAIREENAAVLVEGQMDFLMMWQDGVKNCVATSGTALTGEHLILLKRASENLILIFDNDAAGQTAMERAIDLAGAADMAVKVLPLEFPDLKDPADVVKAKPGLIKEILGKAEPAMKFYFRLYLQKSGMDSVELKKSSRAVLEKIKGLASPVERAYWMRELATRTGIEEKFLHEEMGQIKTAMKQEPAYRTGRSRSMNQEIKDGGVTSKAQSRKELMGERLLSLAMAKGEFLENLKVVQDSLLPSHRQILESLQNPEIQLAAEESALKDMLGLRSALAVEENSNAKEAFNLLLREIKREGFKEKRAAVAGKIRFAELQKDEEALKLALKEFDQISKEMQNV